MTTVLEQIGEECFVKCKKLLIFQVNWMTAITSCELTPGKCGTLTEALLYNESLSAQNETIKVSFKNYIPLYDATFSNHRLKFSCFILPSNRSESFHLILYCGVSTQKLLYNIYIALRIYFELLLYYLCSSCWKFSVNQC